MTKRVIIVRVLYVVRTYVRLYVPTIHVGDINRQVSIY